MATKISARMRRCVVADGWRLVVACPDGAVVTVDVPVKRTFGQDPRPWLATVKVDHSGVAVCHGGGHDAPEAIMDAASALACFGYIVREVVLPGSQTAEERMAGVTAERDAMKAVLLELLTAEIALEAWRPGDAEARDGLVRRLNNAWMSTVDVLGMAR